MEKTKLARCRCGSVAYRLSGKPIVSLVCYCADCQQGGRELEDLPGAARLLDEGGGTACVLYRKDRVACVQGVEHVRSLKLKPTSATNRLIATCCNTPMMMTFDDARHWTPVFQTALGGDAPPLEMRIQTKHRRAAADTADRIRSYPGYPLRFMGKLVWAQCEIMVGR